LALVAIARMPDAPSPASELAPPPGVTGYAYTFSDLLTEADLIVAGTVSSTEPGRTVGEEASELQFLETTLAITSVYAGASATAKVSIETEAEGLTFDREWRDPGTRVVAFLWLKRDADSGGRYFRLLSPEAVAIVEGDTLLPATPTDVSAPLSQIRISDLAGLVRSHRDP
jgi:hypothetical protein